MSSWWSRLKTGIRHAFAVDTDKPLEEADVELLRQLARKVVERRMQAPMTLLVESCRPLNYIGAQAARVLRPIAAQVFAPADYDRFCALLERRTSLDLLCELIVTESTPVAGGATQTLADAVAQSRLPLLGRKHDAEDKTETH